MEAWSTYDRHNKKGSGGMGIQDPDHWRVDEFDQPYQRSFRRRPSFAMKLLVRSIWTLALLAVIYFLYLELGKQAISLVTNIVPVPSKPVATATPTNHDEAIKQFQQQEQTELLRQQANREIAWRKFFTPAPECLDDATVECANAYIKAKRKFDEQYNG